ncbi:Oidioi.mRNA.OKI2018_I69.chr2.g6534.t1.cds [Oikopleura dioica]|uniref:Oidioi.mRNA.OKI2018_I69.chr2.g6534.t1.cds n=1 Tax=Oikopleura dioica TaxID=34765 RepID=A0ABN7TA97_OIKDI|nr:Oidioi.mRNA.OKI2018_I69.chr2.g6534.t1.cds [Oikopleura dioica]
MRSTWLIFLFKDSEANPFCGPAAYLLADQTETLKSPNFPSLFPSQIQCLWNIETDAGSRIKIEFADWDLPMSRLSSAYMDAPQNTMCTAAYLQFTYFDFKKHKSEVKICGANPGFIISNGPRVQIQLHGSDDGRGGLFRLKLSRAPINAQQRLLATDGRSVAEKVKPRRPQKPIVTSSSFPSGGFATDTQSNQPMEKEGDSSEPKSKLPVKWFAILGVLFGFIGIIVLKSKKKKTTTEPSSANGASEESAA